MKTLGIHALPALLGMTLAFISIGCHGRDVPTIWKAELKSPDGAWIAIAHTEQDGGLGSAYIETDVDLKSTHGTVNKGKPFNVLDFDCPGPASHAYVLDNANAGGTIDLKMQWLDPSHLQVSYNGQAKVNFQVVQFAGVKITLQDLSAQGAAPKS